MSRNVVYPFHRKLAGCWVTLDRFASRKASGPLAYV